MHLFSDPALLTILPAIGVLYMFFSVIAFFHYARDKSAARAGRRRIPEQRLLVLGLVGGWPGALLAQQTLRHKTAKRSFQLQFWISVVINLLALCWLIVASQS
jgi:uncharacterized membrane protein YsdA (DUF1294 family)